VEPDKAFITGLFCVILAVPSLLSARIDGRRPVIGGLLLVGGSAAAGWAWVEADGYRLAEIPTMLYAIIGALRN
jgi:hypothetical protein